MSFQNWTDEFSKYSHSNWTDEYSKMDWWDFNKHLLHRLDWWVFKIGQISIQDTPTLLLDWWVFKIELMSFQNTSICYWTDEFSKPTHFSIGLMSFQRWTDMWWVFKMLLLWFFPHIGLMSFQNMTPTNRRVNEWPYEAEPGTNRNKRFLDASTHLYKRVCPSVRPSVRTP